MKRIIAEILAVLSALVMSAFTAAILGGMVGVVFWPIFLIGGLVYYTFARSWMRDVFEVSYRKRNGQS